MVFSVYFLCDGKNDRVSAYPMVYLELVSGLRKGELVALQWSELDEANCTVSVSK